MAGTRKRRQWHYEATISFTATLSESSEADEGASTVSAANTGHVPAQSTAHGHDDVGFAFVNVGQPGSTKDGVNKRAIRSHVARVQHSKARKQSRPKNSTSRKDLSPANVTKADAGSSSYSSSQSSVDPFDQVTDLPSTDPSQATSPSVVPRHDSHSVSTDLTIAFNAPLQYAHLDNRQRSLLNVLSGKQNPFWTYPIPFHPAIERVIDHYVMNFAVDIPFIVPPDRPNLLKTAWFPLTMKSSAAFYPIVLMAATHHALVNPAYANALNLLTLKSLAIAAINTALTDPVQSTSDATLGAVMKMASYEAIFGEERFYKAHMDGLEQLVTMRGGLPNLGMDGLLERIILWIDSNASHHLGCAWKFDKKWHPTTVLAPNPEPRYFAGEKEPPTCPTVAMLAS